MQMWLLCLNNVRSWTTSGSPSEIEASVKIVDIRDIAGDIYLKCPVVQIKAEIYTCFRIYF